MTLVFEKDKPLDFTKGGTLTSVTVGLGWDEAKGGDEYDADVAIIALTGGKLTRTANICFYQQKTAPGMQHTGDDLTGGKSAGGPDEEIHVDLNKVDGDQIDVIATLYDAHARRNARGGTGQSLAELSNAFVQVANKATGEVLGKFAISNSDLKGNAMLFATIKKDASGAWKFEGKAKDMSNGAKAPLGPIVGSYQ